MQRDDHVTFQGVTVLRETSPGHHNQGAIKVRFDDGNEAWIPKSLVHEDSEAYSEGTSGELIVPQWFAEKEGLV